MLLFSITKVGQLVTVSITIENSPYPVTGHQDILVHIKGMNFRDIKALISGFRGQVIGLIKILF